MHPQLQGVSVPLKRERVWFDSRWKHMKAEKREKKKDKKVRWFPMSRSVFAIIRVWTKNSEASGKKRDSKSC